MALSKNVYISDVTNLTEARYYAGMGVSVIGFNATPASVSFANTQLFDAITSWLSGIDTAWQWHQPVSEELALLQQQTPADFIELNHVPSEQECSYLNTPLLLRLSTPEELKAALLLPSERLKGIIWNGEPSLLDEVQTSTTFYVYLQPPFDSLDSISQLEHAGICLKGIPESRPGWNDFDQLADLLESLETY